ncbi:MAG TPA: ribonuclease E inhibitor RraB [Steroidobacteraceae bacterium]|nr:ribonuclease E inhibitor RraB [Steroidobacteraceae bacterium]
MSWLLLVFIVAGAVVLVRIFSSVRKMKGAPDSDWDAKQIEQLRAQGSDPFQPHMVDFFFALPSESACEAIRRQLEFDGFSVDSRAVPDSTEQPFSLHASKSLRISVPDMRDLSRRFGQLASAQGGRYDGWAAGVVRRS